MVSASKPPSGYVAVLSRGAAWISTRLSVAALLGILLVGLLPLRLPVRTAPPLPAEPAAGSAAAAAPVEIVRAVPVPVVAKADRPISEVLPPASIRPAAILQIVARRSGRRGTQREAESGSLGKAGAAASGEKAAATPPADPKAATPKAQAPAPDTWSDAEIIVALRDCLRRLAPLGADIEIAEPVKQERCGAPAPVVLKRLGAGATRVELQPPPTLNCAMVASLNTWVEKTLQPAAQELLGSPVVRIRNLSGYTCRNRIGTVNHADRLSEHALANAIDIGGFMTADGRSINVLSQWGPTARDLREQQEKAREVAQEARAAAKEAEKQAAVAARAAKAARGGQQESAKKEAVRTKDEAERKKEEAQQKEAEWRKAQTRATELQRLGRGTDEERGQTARLRRGDKDRSGDAKGLTPTRRGDSEKTAEGKALTPIPGSSEEDRKSAEAAFLRRLHKGACATFGTVLGPDANEAHRNHFHFDLAARKRSAFCE